MLWSRSKEGNSWQGEEIGKHHDSVSSVAVMSDGNNDDRIVSGGVDGVIQIIDSKGNSVDQIKDLGDGVTQTLKKVDRQTSLILHNKQGWIKNNDPKLYEYANFYNQDFVIIPYYHAENSYELDKNTYQTPASSKE